MQNLILVQQRPLRLAVQNDKKNLQDIDAYQSLTAGTYSEIFEGAQK